MSIILLLVITSCSADSDLYIGLEHHNVKGFNEYYRLGSCTSSFTVKEEHNLTHVKNLKFNSLSDCISRSNLQSTEYQRYDWKGPLDAIPHSEVNDYRTWNTNQCESIDRVITAQLNVCFSPKDGMSMRYNYIRRKIVVDTFSGTNCDLWTHSQTIELNKCEIDDMGSGITLLDVTNSSFSVPILFFGIFLFLII